MSRASSRSETAPPEADPAAPSAIRLRTPAIELAALDYGNPGATPMVLLHGMRDVAWSMDPIARAFRDRFRVVAFDLRGHGDSDKPGLYTLQHYVADLHHGLRELGIERCVLVGHSLGGQVAAHFAGIFPDRVAAGVLIEGLGAPPRQGEDSAAGRRRLLQLQIESLAELPAEAPAIPDLGKAVERMLHHHPRLDPTRARLLARAGTRPDPGGGPLRWKWDPAVQMIWGTFGAEQTEERWTWIECPVLAVSGEVSGERWWRHRWVGGNVIPTRGYLPTPELHRRLSLFRNATPAEIPGAGHMVHFDEPDLLNAAIARFLEGHCRL